MCEMCNILVYSILYMELGICGISLCSYIALL